MGVKKGIQFLPIALFSSVMGLASLTIAYLRLETINGMNHYLSILMTLFVTLIFLLQAYVVIYRMIYHRHSIIEDLNHPVKMNFYGTISISLFLLAVLYYDWHDLLSYSVWLIGAIIQIGLTLRLLTILFWEKTFTIEQFNPTWFIPIVGNIVAPFSGSLHVDPLINAFFFSIGIVFTFVYLVIFTYRMIFIGNLPMMLTPTLFIVIAPLSVGVVAYFNITNEMGMFIYILYGLATYLLLLYIYQWRRFFTIPFTISWWAYLFPLAAYLNSTILLSVPIGTLYIRIWMVSLLIIITGLALYLTIKTLKLLIKGKLFLA